MHDLCPFVQITCVGFQQDIVLEHGISWPNYRRQINIQRINQFQTMKNLSFPVNQNVIR